MTANPVKPARYRAGKAIAEEPSSEEEEEDEDENYEEDDAEAQLAPTAPPPKATSFPSEATKISSNLREVDLKERKRQAAVKEAARVEAEKAAKAKEEEGFVTEESEEEESDGDEESESGSEQSSSEEEAPKVLLRPTFINKDKRKDVSAPVGTKTEDGTWEEKETRRKAKADSMIQEQLDKNAAAQAAGKKNWDDDDEEDGDLVDDTDGLDPETERAAWKLRELKRVKREREAIEVAEKEREEIERRRNLGKQERDAEDRDFLDKQKEEKESRGKMGYMQKYFHKGAYFQDDIKAEGLDRRDIMGSRYQDDVVNRELLPQYMQIRDMTRLGRKGRTKYKDLKSEDTGKWGLTEARGPRRYDGSVDERFMPDRERGSKGASGANATAVQERRKAPEGAPAGPRRARDDTRAEHREHRSEDETYRSDPDDRSRYADDRRRRRSRRRSYSRSRSRSPRRDRYSDEGGGRRKRSRSPYREGHGSDKRRRVEAI